VIPIRAGHVETPEVASKSEPVKYRKLASKSDRLRPSVSATAKHVAEPIIAPNTLLDVMAPCKKLLPDTALDQRTPE